MGNGPTQVSNALNLTLELKDPREMPVLLAGLRDARDRTRTALRALRFVHFARFLPVRGNSSLVVVTEFDGPIRNYVLDFAITIGDVFDAMLAFVKDAPPLPIRNHPDAFMAFVEKNNQIVIRPPDPIVDDEFLFSAYPGLTTIDILEATPNDAVDRLGWDLGWFRDAVPQRYVRADVQGNVLHTRHWNFARHYGLQIASGSSSAANARSFLNRLVEGVDGSELKITTDSSWNYSSAPDPCVCVGFTAHGLKALEVPATVLDRFPTAFLEGPANPRRAAANGDWGDSAPSEWVLGHPSQPIHLLVSLYRFGDQGSSSDRKFEEACSRLQREADDHGLKVVYNGEAGALPEGKVHFGYSEGIAQPRIAVSPEDGEDRANRQEATAGNGNDQHDKYPDNQPTVGLGQFLLGEELTDVYGGKSLRQMAKGLCQNGTFAAVRVMKQDVAAFEGLISNVEVDGRRLHEEYVAAKLMGRWRNGQRLRDEEVYFQGDRLPADADPPQASQRSALNAFDYRQPDPMGPRIEDDRKGFICPIGAHVRRMNPRSARVVGKPLTRRIIRRGMPYGPPWSGDKEQDKGPAKGRIKGQGKYQDKDQDKGHDQDKGKGKDERGLFGLFICSDLEHQYEFLLQQWGRGDIHASGIRGTEDPIIGTPEKNDPDTRRNGRFEIPRRDGAPISIDLPRLVTTRGSVYLFVPGIAGLRCLADGAGFEGEPAPVVAPARSQRIADLRPGDEFSPRDPAFLAHPYRFYARFRASQPVALVQYGSYRSYWVFTKEWVDEVCDAKDDYLKPRSFVSGMPTGAPRRNAPKATSPSEERKHDHQGLFYMNPPRHDLVRSELDAIFPLATRDAGALARMLGDQALRRIPGAEFEAVSSYTRRATRDVFMSLFGIPETRWEAFGELAETILLSGDSMRPAGEVARGDVARLALARELMQLCPTHRAEPGLFERLHGDGISMDLMETLLTAGQFVMGGYLSTDFLLGSGLYNLLRHEGAFERFRGFDLERRRRAILEMARFDSPFQMADRIAGRKGLTLNGEEIPQGHLVTVVYGSANRDETVFGPDSEMFDIDRQFDIKDSYAFGRGIHYCIGASMVAQVAPVLFDRLLAAIPAPGPALAGEPRWLQNPYFRGLASLPLRR